MPNRKLKELVLIAAKAKLEEIEGDFQLRLNELKAVTIGDDNAESASQTESRRGGDLELMGSLADQISNVKSELELLEQIDPAVAHDKVTFGSVVHTDQRNFLIFSGVEDFEADGKHYLGLSPRAPLYSKLQHVSAGTKLEFNGTKYNVKEVF